MDDRDISSDVDTLNATNYNPAYHDGNDENKQIGDDSVKPIFIQEPRAVVCSYGSWLYNYLCN